MINVGAGVGKSGKNAIILSCQAKLLIYKMKTTVKVGIAQAKVPFSIEEGESNILKFVTQAKKEGVEILGFPEDCVCGLFKYLHNYNPLDFLSRTAIKFNINLFGSNTILEEGHFYSTGFYIDNLGKLVSKTRKIILTRPEKETGFTEGNKIEVFNTEYGKMAILVCKDAFNRYAPNWFYELKKKKVEFVLVPSMSLKVDENSIKFWSDSMWLLGRWFDIFILAPGTVGKNYTPFTSYGNSLIVERDKGFLKRGSEDEEELLIAEIPLRSVGQIGKDWQSKWDPPEIPEIEIEEV